MQVKSYELGQYVKVIDNIFPEKFMNTFHRICKELVFEDSLVGGGKGTVNKKIRNSDVVFMFPNELTFAFEKLTNAITQINNNYYKFDIFGFAEGLQFTVYKKNQKYGRHVDRAYKTMTRKLSVSVQLSDPKDYKGGDLVIYEGEHGFEAKRSQGSITVFPSFVEHEVKPVTKGTRYSLVGWITGKDFK